MTKNKYRNNFEQQIGQVLGRKWKYEDLKVPYTVHRNYIPDFSRDGVHIEAKGYFRVGDTQKYKAIRDSLPDGEELVFVLYNPHKKLRKGAKMSMCEWCHKEGFRWYTLETVAHKIDDGEPDAP